MNSQKDDVIYVAVDDGFRRMKLVTSTGTKHSMPSVARSGFSLTLVGGSDAGAGGYETEGRQFTVDAQINGEDTRFHDYAHSDFNRVLVHHMLQEAELGGKRIVLATGLPFQSFYVPNSSDPNQPLIDKKIANLKVAVSPMNGNSSPVIERHQVTAQGLAAYIDHITDEQGDFRDGVDFEAPIAVVDVGGGTVDCVTVYGGGKLDHERSGTGDVGIGQVYDRMDTALRSKFGVTSKIRLQTLDQVARDKHIRLRGTTHDVSDIVDAAVREVCPEIIRKIKSCISDAAEMDSVLLVGGGAALMGEYIKAEYPHAVVPKDPEFANARGMLKYLMLTKE